MSMSDDTPARRHPHEAAPGDAQGHGDLRAPPANWTRVGVDDWMSIMTDRAAQARHNKHAPGVFTDDDYDRFVSWTARQVDL